MRILITGATGFVGRHLSALLLSRKGNEVFGLVRSRSARRLVPGVRPVRVPLLNRSSLSAMLERLRPDRIYHLAGQASVAASWKKPAMTARVNVEGTRCLLEAVRRRAPRARVLLVGSAEVYGRSARRPGLLDEKAPLQPTNPYGRSKARQENLAERYFRSDGLSIVRTRAFNHFGPGQSERFVVPGFARQVALIEAKRRPARIRVGNLAVVRDFTDVRDVVRAYRLALEKGKPGKVYNVASGRPRRIGDVLRFYLRAASVRIDAHPDRARLRPSDTPRLVGNASKLRRATGWTPRFSFERTLRDVLSEWRKKIGRI